MALPWTLEPRPDTGLTNGTLGMWLFLASEVMLFGALFSGYALLRTGSEAWPRGADRLSLALACANTVLLLASSAAVVVAVRGARARSILRARRAVASAAGLGFCFVAIEMYEWFQHLRAGEVPSTDNFWATYYTLTGVHLLHVIGGLGALLHLWGAAARVPAVFTHRLALFGLYWQMVDLVWLVLFTTLYWL